MEENIGAIPGHEPTSYAAYCKSMRAALGEKLFFLDKLPEDVTVVADFGCADGALLKAAQLNRPSVEALIGYDHDKLMLAMAEDLSGQELTDSYGMFAARLHRHHRMGRKSVLVLSSVIHEVVSQGVPWPLLWKATADLGCDYIAIRDMAVSDDQKKVGPPNHVSVLELRATFSIGTMSDYLQAMLKARYPENAKREAEEDYFPVTTEQMLNTCTVGSGYKLRHFEHASLPYVVNEWLNTRGVDLTHEPTHIKMLLKRTR